MFTILVVGPEKEVVLLDWFLLLFFERFPAKARFVHNLFRTLFN